MPGCHCTPVDFTGWGWLTMIRDPRLSLMVKRETLAARHRDLLLQARSREAAAIAKELRRVTIDLLRAEVAA